MLRAEFQQQRDSLTLKLEGRLVSEWAEQVKLLVTQEILPTKFVVDLTDVTYLDSIGEKVLVWLGSIHAVFVAETSYARDICERLHLILKGDPSTSSRPAAQAGRS